MSLVLAICVRPLGETISALVGKYPFHFSVIWYAFSDLVLRFHRVLNGNDYLRDQFAIKSFAFSHLYMFRFSQCLRNFVKDVKLLVNFFGRMVFKFQVQFVGLDIERDQL